MADILQILKYKSHTVNLIKWPKIYFLHYPGSLGKDNCHIFKFGVSHKLILKIKVCFLFCTLQLLKAQHKLLIIVVENIWSSRCCWILRLRFQNIFFKAHWGTKLLIWKFFKQLHFFPSKVCGNSRARHEDLHSPN